MDQIFIFKLYQLFIMPAVHKFPHYPLPKTINSPRHPPKLLPPVGNLVSDGRGPFANIYQIAS